MDTFANLARSATAASRSMREGVSYSARSARAVVSPYHLAPNCSSLIEREFLLWCLAMMFENIC